jgi:uncharacterized protein (TIGR01777 family)
MRIIVSGATGLIGSALTAALQGQGHHVTALTRSRPTARAGSPPAIQWNPSANLLEAAALEGAGAVVHLAGENIAAARWTPEFKARLRDSRIGPTRLLAHTLAGLRGPPPVLLCASAVGIYGNRGDEVLTEDSPPGTGFLAELGRDWEAAAEPARAAGLRVIHLRFGVVLSARGGALAKMLPLFRAGLAGPLGHGRQWWPWLSLADAVGILQFALAHLDLCGPVNAVAPQAVTNAEFTHTLGRVLHRPTRLPVPAWALRLAVGEMADAALLASARVEPVRLRAGGYPFVHPTLESALRAELDRDRARERAQTADV